MNTKKASAIFLAICLILAPTAEAKDDGWSLFDCLAMAGGAAVAVVAVPAAVAAAGFGAGGIAAGSLAAKGMSL